MGRLLLGVLVATASLSIAWGDLEGQTSAVPGLASAPNSNATIVPGRYIVVFQNSAHNPLSLANQIAVKHGGSVYRVYEHALKGSSMYLTPDAVDLLRNDPDVAYVEPDRYVQIFGTQNNPPNWALDRADQIDLPLDNTFQYGNDASGFDIYIVDSGVRSDHIDFGGRVQFVSNGAGGDFVNDGHGDAEDCFGHGTFVAGAAAGDAHGVAKDATIWAARVIDCQGNGSASMALAAVDWITANGQLPAVVNMSLGYVGVQALTDAVENSIAAGFVYVVAAGNQIVPQDACLVTPANAASAITVGATDINDNEATFSNYGTCVDLLAGGSNVLSTAVTSPTATETRSGTSAAAAVVSGAAALYMTANPDATPAEVLAALVDNATPNRITLHSSSQSFGTPNLLLYTDFIGSPGSPGPNNPPTLTAAIPDTTVVVGAPAIDDYRDFNEVFADAEDGDSLSFSIVSNTDASLVVATIDAADSTLDISFGPGTGSATIIVRALDSESATVQDTFVVTVTPAGNTAPFVVSAIPDTTVIEDSGAIQGYRDLNVVFSDAEDGGNLAFSIVSSSDSALVTPTIDMSDSTLDLAMGADEVGQAVIVVRAMDLGALVVHDTFVVTVTDVNDPPVVVMAMPDTTLTENDSLQNYRDLNEVFSDLEEGSVLSFVVASVSNPTLLTATIDADSALDINLFADQTGSAEIVVRATDSGALSANDTLIISVSPASNTPPVVVAAIPDTVVLEDSPAADNYRDLNDVFFDAEDGGSLAFVIESNSNSGVVSAVIDADSALDLSFTPGQTGMATIVIRATDSAALSVADTLVVSVVPANYTPTVVSPIGDPLVAEDAAPLIAYRDLNDVFDDVEDKNQLAFSIAANSDTALVTVLINPADSTLDLSFGPDENGVATVVVRATDSGGLSVDDSLNVIVIAANDRPVVTNAIPDTAVTLGSMVLGFRDLRTVFDDVEDGSNVVYEVMSNTNDSLVSVDIDTSGYNLDLVFAPGVAGSANIVIRATDTGGLWIEDTFVLTAVTNTPPFVAAAIPDTTVTDGNPTIEGFRDLNDVFFDAEDGGSLAFVIESNSNSAVVAASIDADSALDLSFGLGQVGSATIVIRATDSGVLSVTDTLVVSVLPANQPPAVVAPVADPVVAEDTAPISAYRDLNSVFYDVEDGDQLAFSILGNSDPTLVTVSVNPVDSTIDLSFGPDRNGVATVVVRATDSAGLSVDDSLDVIVIAANDRPVVANAIPDTTVVQGTILLGFRDLRSVFDDVEDGAGLAFEVSSNTNDSLVSADIAPSGYDLDLVFTPGVAGSANIVVRATDTGGSWIEDVFVVTTAPVNTAPTVVSAVPDTTVNENNPSFVYRDLNDVFDDVEDDDSLDFAVVGNSNPGLITASMATAGAGSVSFRSVATANVGNGDSVYVGVPSGTAAGDLLIAALTVDGETPLSALSGGWTLIEGGGANPGEKSPSVGVWYKLAGGSEPSSYLFSADVSGGMYCAVLRYTGHDPLNPIHVSAIDYSAGSTTPTAPSVTTTLDSCLILRIFGADDDDTPYAVPGGHAERFNGTNGAQSRSAGSAGADVQQGAAGPTGTGAFTMAAVEEWQAVTVAIAPALFSEGQMLLAFTPDADGSATIAIRATDTGALSAQDTFVVTVNPANNAPVVAAAIPDTVIVEDSPTIAYRDLNDVFTDSEDGSALDFTVLGNSNPLLITPSIDSADSTLDLAVLPDANGVAAIVIRATDTGALTVDDTLVVTVSPVNDVPIIISAMPDTAVNEDNGVIDSFRDLNAVFDDIEDGNALTFSIEENSNPSLVAPVIDPSDSTLDLTLGPDQNGSATLVVRAEDSGALTVDDTLVVTVSPVNDAPFVTAAMSDTSVVENNPAIDNYANLLNVFDDIEDGAALSFVVFDNSDTALVTATIGPDSALDLSFGPGQSGSAIVIVRATDSGALSVDDTIQVTVTPVDTPPTIVGAIPDTTVTEDSPAVIGYRDLNTVFDDAEDGNALAFSIGSNSNASLVTPTISGTDSTLNLSFGADESGSAAIVIRATDSSAQTIDDTLVVTVTPVDDPPIVAAAIPDTTVIEDNPAVVNYVDLNEVFADVEDGGALTFAIASNSYNSLVNATIDPADSTLDLTFGADLGGNSATIVVSATDSGAQTVEDTFVVFVTAVNDVPVVAQPMPDTTLAENSTVDSYRDLNFVFHDVEDGDSLAFAVQSNSNPSLLAVTIDPADSTLDVSAQPGQAGSATVVLRATDSGGLSVDDSLMVIVTTGNTKPVVVAAIPDTAVFEDESKLNYRDLNEVFDDAEDGSALSFSIEVNTNPSLMTPTIDPADSSLDLILAPGQSGVSVIVVRATDSGALWEEDTFVLTVLNVTDPPIVLQAIPDTTVAMDSPPIENHRDLNDVFWDEEDGNVLEFAVESNSNSALVSAVIDADSALDLSMTPAMSGQATLIIRARDSSFQFVRDTLVVTVAPSNFPPVVVNAIPDTVVVRDSPPIDNYRDLNGVFADPEEGGALTFLITSNSDTNIVMASIDADSALDLSFGAGMSGDVTIVIQATDSAALSVSDTVVVTVNGMATGIPDPTERYVLEQNVPNPFNPTTIIRFETAEPGMVSLRVFDVSGRLIRTLMHRGMPAARHEVEWDGRDDRGVAVSSGVYFYRIEIRDFRSTKKMIMLK